MRQRLPLAISLAALVVAVLGSTPFGRAASDRVAKAVVPGYAKTAGYAKFAGDSTKLNGRKSALSGAPGTILAVGSSGKLPASLVDMSQLYTKSQVYSKSEVDALVKPLATQLKALTGSNVVDGSLTLSDLGGKRVSKEQTTSVSSAIALPAGSCKAQLTANYGDAAAGSLVVGTLTNASGDAVLPNTAAVMPALVIKTTQGGAVPNLVVCNTGSTALTVPAGSVFHWRLIDP